MMKFESLLGSWKRSDGPPTDFLLRVAEPHPLPSLRIPVTPENRELLRRLRAAEAAAWEASAHRSDSGQLKETNRPARPAAAA